MKKAWVLSYPLSAQQRFWSAWADAQADLSFRWAHTHFVCFVMLWLGSHVCAMNLTARQSWMQELDRKIGHLYCAMIIQVQLNVLQFTMFSDRQVRANIVEPDQTAPEAVWSGPTPFRANIVDGSILFAILSASFRHISLWQSNLNHSNFRMITAIFWESRLLGFLRYIVPCLPWYAGAIICTTMYLYKSQLCAPQFFPPDSVTVHRPNDYCPVFIHDTDLLSVSVPRHATNHGLVSVVYHLFIPGTWWEKEYRKYP